MVYGGVEIHRVGDSTQQCELSIYSPLSMMENLKTEHVHNIRGVFCDTNSQRGRRRNVTAMSCRVKFSIGNSRRQFHLISFIINNKGPFGPLQAASLLWPMRSKGECLCAKRRW